MERHNHQSCLSYSVAAEEGPRYAAFPGGRVARALHTFIQDQDNWCADQSDSTVLHLVQNRPALTRICNAALAVFFRSKKQTHRTTILLGLMGLNAGELHGNLTQLQRLEALEEFRDGKVKNGLTMQFTISTNALCSAVLVVRLGSD